MVFIELDQIAKVTKKQVMEFAKKWYNNNYVVVYKRSGENKNAQKVPKPAITPVVINKNVSDFTKKLMDTPADKLQPRFTDFNKDINKETLNGSIPVYADKAPRQATRQHATPQCFAASAEITNAA